MVNARRSIFRLWSWKLRRQRAVSPILAIILLLAVTVVLAATLFLVVSQYTRNTPTTPIGSLFLAGPATPSTGTPQTNSYCQSSHYCYAIQIDMVSGGLTLGDLSFRVVNQDNVPHVVTKNFAKISVVGPMDSVLADSQVTKNHPFVVTSWQVFSHGVSRSTPTSDLQVIWVQFGNTASSPAGQGYSLEVLGQGSFSGSESIPLS
jgi:flagellin-like protein